MTSPRIEQLGEQIEAAQYREATETFCQLVAEGSEPLETTVHRAISAAAPYVQVPSHLMKQPNGDMRGVPYDHTILAWRGALTLVPKFSKRRAVLPAVQAMWYAPQGLNIWEQVICEFPGHYAVSEKCNQQVPGPQEEINRFAGPRWTTPKIHFKDHGPIVDGSAEERLERFNWAIAEGNREETYGLFLGLAGETAQREHLKERVLFAGITDLQDTMINRGGYQNLGHKALRARALVDIADHLGWDNAHEVMYTVVPDLGCSPRLYGMWNEIGSLVTMLPRLKNIPKRGVPLDERRLDQLREAMLWGGPFEVNDAIIDLYTRGAGILDVADGIVVGAQRYIVDVLENATQFGSITHAFDYCNVVNTWLRNHDTPEQVKGPFMAARFVNDTIRLNAMAPRDPKASMESPQHFRPWADGLEIDRILPELEANILTQDASRACALVESYLQRTEAREPLIASVTYAACHFQNDPHIIRNCASSIEEFTLNQTSRRDDILRGFVKHQARYLKRARTHEAFEMYTQYFEGTSAR